MLDRKLFAAFFTSVICYFIVPLFFDDASDSYFVIGFSVSIVTVPILFVVGILSSLAFESFNFSKNIVLSYLIHLGCAVLCAFVFSLTATGVLFIAILISFVYATIFFIIDNLSRYIERVVKKK